MKLKDVYIVFQENRVRVLPKSMGKPRKIYHVVDPSDYDLSDLAHFFLETFTSLTCGETEFQANPRQVYNEFCKIQEFETLDDVNLWLPDRKRQAELEAEIEKQERAASKRKAA